MAVGGLCWADSPPEHVPLLLCLQVDGCSLWFNGSFYDNIQVLLVVGWLCRMQPCHETGIPAGGNCGGTQAALVHCWLLCLIFAMRCRRLAAAA